MDITGVKVLLVNRFTNHAASDVVIFQKCKLKPIENEERKISKVELLEHANQNGLVVSLSFKQF